MFPQRSAPLPAILTGTMSEQNLEAIRRLIEHFDRTGVFGPPELFDPEVTVKTRGDLSPLTYTGHQGLEQMLASFQEVWDRIEPNVVELVDGDDVVVAVIRFALRSQSGVELEIEEGWGYWFRDDRIVRVEQHPTPRDALVAAGLD